MAINQTSRRWTMAIQDRKGALNYFAIMIDERMPKNSI